MKTLAAVLNRLNLTPSKKYEIINLYYVYWPLQLPGEHEENDWICNYAKEDDEGQEDAERNVHTARHSAQFHQKLSLLRSPKGLVPVIPFETRCQ